MFVPRILTVCGLNSGNNLKISLTLFFKVLKYKYPCKTTNKNGDF